MFARSLFTFASFAAASFGAAAAFAAPSDGMADREVNEALVAQASSSCPGYKADYAEPLQKLDVGIGRSLLNHHILVCPAPALDAHFAVVWYGNHSVFTWNPELKESPAVLTQVLDKMTRADSFPEELWIYDPNGQELKNQLAPGFRSKCGDYRICS